MKYTYYTSPSAYLTIPQIRQPQLLGRSGASGTGSKEMGAMFAKRRALLQEAQLTIAQLSEKEDLTDEDKKNYMQAQSILNAQKTYEKEFEIAASIVEKDGSLIAVGDNGVIKNGNRALTIHDVFLQATDNEEIDPMYAGSVIGKAINFNQPAALRTYIKELDIGEKTIEVLKNNAINIGGNDFVESVKTSSNNEQIDEFLRITNIGLLDLNARKALEVSYYSNGNGYDKMQIVGNEEEAKKITKNNNEEYFKDHNGNYIIRGQAKVAGVIRDKKASKAQLIADNNGNYKLIVPEKEDVGNIAKQLGYGYIKNDGSEILYIPYGIEDYYRDRLFMDLGISRSYSKTINLYKLNNGENNRNDYTYLSWNAFVGSGENNEEVFNWGNTNINTNNISSFNNVLKFIGAAATLNPFIIWSQYMSYQRAKEIDVSTVQEFKERYGARVKTYTPATPTNDIYIHRTYNNLRLFDPDSDGAERIYNISYFVVGRGKHYANVPVVKKGSEPEFYDIDVIDIVIPVNEMAELAGLTIGDVTLIDEKGAPTYLGKSILNIQDVTTKDYFHLTGEAKQGLKEYYGDDSSVEYVKLTVPAKHGYFVDVESQARSVGKNKDIPTYSTWNTYKVTDPVNSTNE